MSYAQASKKFEGVEFTEWRKEFIAYKAIVIFDEQPDDPSTSAIPGSITPLA